MFKVQSLKFKVQSSKFKVASLTTENREEGLEKRGESRG